MDHSSRDLSGRKRKRASTPTPSLGGPRRRPLGARGGLGVVHGLRRREMGSHLKTAFFASALSPRPVLTLVQAVRRNQRLRRSSLMGFVDPGLRLIAMGGMESIEIWNLDANRKSLELFFEVSVPTLQSAAMLGNNLRSVSVTQTEDGSAMIAGICREECDMQISIFAISRASQHVASFMYTIPRRLERTSAHLINEDMLGFDWESRDHVLVLPLEHHALLATTFCSIDDIGNKLSFPSQVPFCRWRWISPCAPNVHMSNSSPETALPEDTTTGMIIIDQVRIDIEALLARSITLNLGLHIQGVLEEERRPDIGHCCEINGEGACAALRRARRRLASLGSKTATHIMQDFEYKLLSVSASGKVVNVACVARLRPLNEAETQNVRDVGLLLSICVKTGKHRILQSLSAPTIPRLRDSLAKFCKRLQKFHPLPSRVQKTQPRSVSLEHSILSLANLESPSTPLSIVHTPGSRVAENLASSSVN